jgi:predicted transcriptional regulator|tara:strand:- start:153 stop:329 length:177 start_codon:yes stop_codon:yes gene_type:complete
VLDYDMKKISTLSFRTTPENDKYLRKLADSDDRSLSYVLNKMVNSFRDRGVKKVSSIK